VAAVAETETVVAASYALRRRTGSLIDVAPLWKRPRRRRIRRRGAAAAAAHCFGGDGPAAFGEDDDGGIAQESAGDVAV